MAKSKAYRVYATMSKPPAQEKRIILGEAFMVKVATEYLSDARLGVLRIERDARLDVEKKVD